MKLLFKSVHAPLAALLLAAAPAAEATPAFFTEAFPGTDGETASLQERMGDARYLVVTFFSASCPCQAAHDGRLIELHRDMAGGGVAFVSVDSEARSSLEKDKKEANERGYPFPIVSDPKGALAKALGARFATHTVILDREGQIRYRGGLDTDRSRLTDNAKHWARMALQRLAAGEAPDPTETKAFGCFLGVAR